MIAASAVLGGCASANSAPANAPASAYAWHYQQVEGEGEKLAYGAPDTDDVVLMMVCAPGSGRVELSALMDQPRNELVLLSGADQRRYPAVGGTSELDGGAIVQAQAEAKAPVLNRFAETGELAMLAGDHQVDLAARGADRDGVRQFFEGCV